jgi:arginine/lysine/ornithine decarboxylase
VYFFAQSADLNRQIVRAYVTGVRISDRDGRVLAEYRPQGD